MPLNLPDQKQPRKVRLAPRQSEGREVKEDARTNSLSTEDTIEYGVTMEISPGPGQKAWIRFGTTSSVREHETAEEARERVVNYVDQNLERLINER